MAARFLARIRVGVLVGCAVGVVFSLIALAQALTQQGDPFSKLGTTAGVALLAYLTMGTISGLVVALVWPLGRWALGAAIIGFLAAVPVWFIAGVTVTKEDPLSTLHTALVLSAIFGPATGFAVWYQVRDFHRNRWR